MDGRAVALVSLLAKWIRWLPDPVARVLRIPVVAAPRAVTDGAAL
jgi:hypothetical protein